MKIALIGYGKMGRMIERLAEEQGDRVVCHIDMGEEEKFDSPEFKNADVAIEFSVPTAARGNVERALCAGVPVVSGTTGWSDKLPQMKALAEDLNGSLLWASNFSVGVNIFMTLNRNLARMMNSFEQYLPALVETHHVHKLDHPSGTAVTLAEGIVGETARITEWTEPTGKPISDNQLAVSHIRRGEVAGIHSIVWDSPQDEIAITHSAKGREGFALGAILAARWLINHPGVHDIAEVYASAMD